MKALFLRFVSHVTFTIFAATMLAAFSISGHAASKNTQVLLETSLGNIEIELYDRRTPVTVSNFLSYVEAGFYNNTLFHRVIPNFMIQGGGFDQDFNKKQTKPPIKNEANAFIPNLRGTIAMARTNDPHSATAQFFINVVDNNNLNKSSYNAGYAVFGKVINGMDVADNISKAKTKAEGYMRDIPVTPIVLKSVRLISPAEAQE